MFFADSELMHYGMPKRSGRYPWGSGEDPYQHTGDFLSRVEQMKNEGFTFTDSEGKTWTGDTAIAKSMGKSSTEFKKELAIAKHERKIVLADKVKALSDKGYTPTEIARMVGFAHESSVRSLLTSGAAARANQAKVTADILKKEVASKKMIDIGSGVEKELGISREKLNEAVKLLEKEGYEHHTGKIEQVTNRQKWTTLNVLCAPGTPKSEMYNYENIKSVKDYTSADEGMTYDPVWTYPKSMDSKRLQIRYAEDGGLQKDGVIELRRNVPDLSLGDALYSQVRILVDNSRYLKGMAVYSDNMPDGVDVIFNTNKSSSVPKMKVLKEIKNDPNNPFGSLIKEGIVDPDKPERKVGGQSYYYDENGKKQLSLINKRAEEGDWSRWSNTLPSQFLSKQNLSLIKRQLHESMLDKKAEYDDICALDNAVIKRTLLQTFSDDCDSAAVHLKAAALPRQAYKVILPLTSIKDNEVYAPGYKDGESVALVRFPHGGLFEIPVLTVNNRNKEGKNVLGNTPKDAIGINSKVASQLSGADFDGDTVMVIPTGGKYKVSHQRPLEGLKDFDPTMNYGPDSDEPYKIDPKTGTEYYSRDGHVYARMRNKQTEMGVISNLITDMTIRGATDEELARAVRHSMVVIDAEKHKLDYKASEKKENIAALKKRYQAHIEDGVERKGASTLISRSSAEVDVPKRRGDPIIDPKTGALSWKPAGETFIDPKTGKTRIRTQKSTQMAETPDARKLSSGTQKEEAYAEYANELKALANKARKEMLATPKLVKKREASIEYADAVATLTAKLNTALKNAPRERQAQIIATTIVNAKQKEHPDMTKAEKKKASQQALVDARIKVGAKRRPIREITDREWEAIQSGAISDNKLAQILKYTDIDSLRQRATPRSSKELSPSRVNRINSLAAAGYTTAQIAAKMSVSTSTVAKYIDRKE